MPIRNPITLVALIATFFYLVGRFVLPWITGEPTDKRITLVLTLFGSFLVPTLWVAGYLGTIFPNVDSLTLIMALLIPEYIILFGILYSICKRKPKNSC